MRLSSTFFDCAESSLIVSFGSQYSKELSLAILDLSRRLEDAKLPGFLESIPALSTLAVFYDPFTLPREKLTGAIEALCAVDSKARLLGRLWEIPAVYGGEHGPDLESAAELAGLSSSEAVKLHSSQVYHVYMLGFLPGFAYLGDLPQPLQLSRRATPRARVPAGSVAIASDMTAVYPLESPGGWHLIGWSPLILWDMAISDEPLLKPGDRVRFLPTTPDEADRLKAQIGQGWRPQPLEAE
jgi:KipI family sensor histidine kinase inhibitor